MWVTEQSLRMAEVGGACESGKVWTSVALWTLQVHTGGPGNCASWDSTAPQDSALCPSPKGGAGGWDKGQGPGGLAVSGGRSAQASAATIRPHTLGPFRTLVFPPRFLVEHDQKTPKPRPAGGSPHCWGLGEQAGVTWLGSPGGVLGVTGVLKHWQGMLVAWWGHTWVAWVGELSTLGGSSGEEGTLAARLCWRDSRSPGGAGSAWWVWGQEDCWAPRPIDGLGVVRSPAETQGWV